MGSAVDHRRNPDLTNLPGAPGGTAGPDSPAFRVPEGPEQIRRLAAGDHRALGELYDGYSQFVSAQATRILRDPSQVEAVVQEVFVRVWNEVGSFDPSRETPEAWLTHMARGIALERRRQRVALPPRSNGAAPDGVYALWNEDALAVRKAIDTLPPDQRRLMNLACFEGFTPAEIAARLREPLETVTDRIRVAMLRVRQALTRHRLERWGVAPMVVHARLLARLEAADGDSSLAS